MGPAPVHRSSASTAAPLSRGQSIQPVHLSSFASHRTTPSTTAASLWAGRLSVRAAKVGTITTTSGRQEGRERTYLQKYNCKWRHWMTTRSFVTLKGFRRQLASATAWPFFYTRRYFFGFLVKFTTGAYSFIHAFRSIVRRAENLWKPVKTHPLSGLLERSRPTTTLHAKHYYSNLAHGTQNAEKYGKNKNRYGSEDTLCLNIQCSNNVL